MTAIFISAILKEQITKEVMTLLAVQSWVDITTIIANIVTILGLSSLVLIGISLIKNRFSKKTVTAQIEHSEPNTNYNSPSCDKNISFSIDLFNSTDKTFFVTGVFITLNKQTFQLVYKNKSNTKENVVKNVCVEAFAAKTIEGRIEFSNKITLPKTYSVTIKTTLKDLTFDLDF